MASKGQKNTVKWPYRRTSSNISPAGVSCLSTKYKITWTLKQYNCLRQLRFFGKATRILATEPNILQAIASCLSTEYKTMSTIHFYNHVSQLRRFSTTTHTLATNPNISQALASCTSTDYKAIHTSIDLARQHARWPPNWTFRRL